MQDLSFREADRDDIPAITRIHNSNVRGQPGWEERGFLLAPTTENEVLRDLERSTRYFVATQRDRNVIGFVALSQPKISDEMLNKIIWKDNTFKTKVTQDNHFYLQILVIHPNFMGKGVAQFLYKSLYQQFPNSYLSALVVTRPITNNRSLKFHQKQGFEWIGILRTEQFLDLINYESIVFFKET